MRRELYTFYARNRNAILLFVVGTIFVLLYFCANYFVTVSENNYSHACQYIKTGDLENALIKLDSVSWMGRAKYELPILRGIVHRDIDASVTAIYDDSCFGKCFHVIENWESMMTRYIDTKHSNAERQELIHYRESVVKVLIAQDSEAPNFFGESVSEYIFSQNYEWLDYNLIK